MKIDEEHLFWGTARGVLFIMGLYTLKNDKLLCKYDIHLDLDINMRRT